MSKKKTHEEFCNEVYDLVGNEYSVIGEYINASTKITMKHNTCRHVWDILPAKFTGKVSRRCEVCGGSMKKTNEEFVKEVYDLVGDEYEFLETYINSLTPIECIHKVCGRIYKVTPSDFLHGKRCAKCAGNLLKTTDDYRNEIYELYGDEYTILGEYINAKSKILTRHNSCGHEYYIEPTNLLRGIECPKCNESKGEKRIQKYLDINSINYIPQMKYDGLIGVGNGLLSYDFYLPSYNILIEYQGQFHDGTAKMQSKEQYKKQKEHDRRKKQYSIDNNIKLLEIWYLDFENIEEILNKELDLSSNSFSMQ